MNQGIVEVYAHKEIARFPHWFCIEKDRHSKRAIFKIQIQNKMGLLRRDLHIIQGQKRLVFEDKLPFFLKNILYCLRGKREKFRHRDRQFKAVTP